MNSRKLPKEQRNRLVLVALATLIAVAGLYFGLIRRQNESLAHLAQKKDAAAKKLQVVLDTVRRDDQIKADLDDARKALAAAESDVASGDLYAWVINWLRGFKASYKVEIPQFSQLSTPADVNLLPNFPYKQTALTVAGTAHFHDLGRFLADLENHFPHIRLLNLSLDANAPSATVEPETLSFKIDIVTLAKVNPS
jgi:Tfp pilus assembly protein PilO